MYKQNSYIINKKNSFIGLYKSLRHNSKKEIEQKIEKEKLNQIVIRVSERDKKDFKSYCCEKDISMTESLGCIVEYIAQKWRIENGKEIFEDFSEETKEAINELRDEEHVKSLPIYNDVDEMFRALGVK